MGIQKKIGIILLIVGSILVVLSLTADVINVGLSSNFGPKQITGTIFGIISLVVGLFLSRKK